MHPFIIWQDQLKKKKAIALFLLARLLFLFYRYKLVGNNLIRQKQYFIIFCFSKLNIDRSET